MPLWFLKAMNLGLPIVATAVGGTPEVVRNRRNGGLISASDDEALHEALSGLIATPFDRQRFRDWERQTIERFSLASMTAQTERLLHDGHQVGVK